MIDIQLSADAAFMRLLSLDNAQVRQAVANALNETAILAQDLIGQATPVDTSRLRGSWTLYPATPSELQAVVATNVDYAPFVEFGTGVHSESPLSNKQPFKVKAKNAKALKFTAGGETLFRKSVTIQGMKPRAMVRRSIPAIDAKLNEALRLHVGNLLRGQ